MHLKCLVTYLCFMNILTNQNYEYVKQAHAVTFTPTARMRRTRLCDMQDWPGTCPARPALGYATAQNGNVLLGLSKNECCQLSTTEVMSTGAGASGLYIATIIAVG